MINAIRTLITVGLVATAPMTSAAALTADELARLYNDPLPGKYFCYITNLVGMQGDSQTGKRFAGKLVPPEGEQKFFITIEANRQPPEDCFNDGAADALKKLRRGEKTGRSSIFGHPLSYYQTCLNRFRLRIKRSGGEFEYYGDSTVVFKGNIDVFRLDSDLSYVWLLYIPVEEKNRYLEEGKCEKIN